MDKKIKRNLTIMGIFFIVLFVGVVAIAQLGANSSKNDPNLNINEVAGVNNVELSKTEFIPVNISENGTMLGINKNDEGYDKFHDSDKNVYVYHTPSKTTIEMESETHDISVFTKQQSNSTLTKLTVVNITGITTNTVEKLGIKQGNVDLYDTFYFIEGNTTYTINYQNKSALESFLTSWIKAYNAKQ